MSENDIKRVQNAADRIESAVHKLSLMFEDGYGGNGLRLIYLLEDLKSEEIDYFKKFIVEKVLGKE